MKDKKEFYNLLAELDGQPISEYQELVGDFDFTRYVVKCGRITIEEGEVVRPVFTVRVPQTIAEIPEYLFDSPVRRTAMEDYLLRRIDERVGGIANFDGSGVARRHISVATPNQKILPRNALMLTKEYIEVRFSIALPVQVAVIDGEPQYAIDGEMCQQIFYEDLPEVVANSLLCCNLEIANAEEHVNGMEDADCLRQYLGAAGEIAFVSSGSMVTREIESDEPDYQFFSPVEVEESIVEEVEVPHGGSVKGVGIPTGLTLILGEASSGRSDLMDAIGQGIYNHVPGDGREQVVTVADAVAVRSEEGRSVQQVDISAFASVLADGGKPTCYSSKSAGAFTSQAAGTVEALEAGARVLLYDESTSSSTFLSCDSRVSALMTDRCHTSLAARARQIVDELGVSMVVGGSSFVAEFIPIADKILKVENFVVTDITEEAKALGVEPAVAVGGEVVLSSLLSRSRWIMPSSIDPSVGREDLLVEVEDRFMQFGRSVVDMEMVKQMAADDQARAVGFILYYSKLRYMDEGYPLREILDLVDRDLSNEGLNSLVRETRGDLARPRRYEIAAVLNRMPAFRVSHVTE